MDYDRDRVDEVVLMRRRPAPLKLHVRRLQFLRVTPMRTALLLCLLLATNGCGDSPNVQVHPGSSSVFQPGQVWAYRTRPYERGSRFVVLRVDSVQGHGTVVHVRIVGLKIQHRLDPRPIELIGHIPISEAALKRSATRLVRTEEVPDFREGYVQWLQSGSDGSPGIFTVDLADAVAAVERIIQSPPQLIPAAEPSVAADAEPE